MGRARILWAIAAGALFGVVRLVVVAPIVGNPLDFQHRAGDFTEEFREYTRIASASAALSGTVFWWLLISQWLPRLKRGAMAGLLAALGSYAGNFLFADVEMRQRIWWFLMAHGVTGWIVYPAMATAGVVLGLLQRNSARDCSDANASKQKTASIPIKPIGKKT